MDSTEVLNPLVASWLGKIQEAKRFKKRFNDTAHQCMQFFSGSCGFMWQPAFMQRFLGSMPVPTFRMTIAKAFELVALYGPTLYWRNPTRMVKPRKRVQLDPALFTEIDPTGYLMYQQALGFNSQQMAIEKAVCELQELYLNYTPTEQPGGGLAAHASDAITEALVKGRGCLWPQPYIMPGSSRVMTGCFQDSVDNLLIDPDATSLHNAKWIAQQVTLPTWEWERMFGLPTDSLRGRGTAASADAQGRAQADEWGETEMKAGKSFDLMTGYKIYSKGGVGGRLAGPARLSDELSRAFDEVIGDYAYIVVAPNVPWPLNAPREVIQNATDAEIKRRFSWPVPYWRDDRWPVVVLDFYREPNNVWPIAPLAPGLGELTFLNIFMSHIAHHIWMSTRTIIGGPRSLEQSVRASLLSGQDFAYVGYDANQGHKLSEALDFMKLPPMNHEAWKLVEVVSSQFDRRVGLTELLYGLNPGGVQIRTAEDAANKNNMVSIRPDYMAAQVEDWMTDAAEAERMCANVFVKASDLDSLFGPVEQMLWDRHISNADPEYIFRGMRATVAANSTRKPDKTRDIQNMNQALQVIMPLMQAHMMATGDVSGVNGLLAKWGQTIDQDMSGLFIPPFVPQAGQADQAAMEAQQLQQQLQQQAHEQQLAMNQQTHEQRLAIQAGQFQQQTLMNYMRMRQMQQHMELEKKKARQLPAHRRAA